jgi:phosphoribosylformylglycinamidine synthase
MSVFEVYVERKPEYAEEALELKADLCLTLQLSNISRIRIINRYFAEGITVQDLLEAKTTVFSEPPLENVYDTLPVFTDASSSSSPHVFALEFLPGQFDQRAESCAQCISFATGKERPVIKTAKIYAIYGNLCESDLLKIKSWLINPVECRETQLEKPLTLIQEYPQPDKIEAIEGFISFTDEDLQALQKKMNLAMDLQDLQFCQRYFRDEEKRDPSETEIRVLDTYWSDHCRHTTFLTELEKVVIEDKSIRESFENYLTLRSALNRSDKPITLMDMATIGAKVLKQKGLLCDLDESEEVNACSVKIKVDVDGKDEDWLLMFKNETHNHPTEIEPFGGAATCLGGAIRDPLSGRAYVYQAMRITGAGNPLENVSDTLPGKLPQIKICRTAAAGYSSYGNQIGLATGHVHEIYHEGYTAKRMELGALIGAAPASNVVRASPREGDVVILLGGRTGRDGIGGATGSSKSHTTSSLETCGADVQKGSPQEERKIQRLFRNPDATRLIKKCNDFGAGGVSVSVGELADGLFIDLNKVPKKYQGLNGTELAISESQERMSIVVDKKDVNSFLKLAADENLEATVIAEVTSNNRMVMNWNGNTIVNLSRKFLNSNGERKFANVQINKNLNNVSGKKIKTIAELKHFFGSLDICSQKGLVQRFDPFIGAATVILPFGGKYQLTPAQTMAAKIPVLSGETKTCSLMSWGFDPYVSSANPYHGAVFAVVHSLAKIIANGGSRKKAYLSFQEYFEKLRDDPLRWGKPVSALLGALDAQLGLEIAAIGGKDSMSGSFSVNENREINVPETLVSFAVSTAKIDNIITPEFKKTQSYVYLFKPPFSFNEKPDFVVLRDYFDTAEKLIKEGIILSAWAAGSGGVLEAVLKMCLGNNIGFSAEDDLETGFGFSGFIVETEKELCEVFKNKKYEIVLLGKTSEEYRYKTPSFEISIEELQKIWENTLEPVYPSLIKQEGKAENLFFTKKEESKQIQHSKNKKPKFLIPVFPGTNSEYDSIKAIKKAGGTTETIIIRNLTPDDISQSVKNLVKAIKNTNVIFLPGGFSGGDEPAGSGKFITSFFNNNAIIDAITELLQKRDGLIGGICNGFQALVKLGLVPYGEIRKMTDNSPTLANNTIGRHQATLVNTKIVSNKSPWLSHLEPGSQYIVPISHGEGRFLAEESLIRELADNGQIATQYVDFEGNATQDIRFNPNNSAFAIEGITSPDGRVFGRMAHNERYDEGLYKNIPGMRKMDIFFGAVKYFC